MNKLPSYQYYHCSTSSSLDVVLHGRTPGIDSPFIEKVFNYSKHKGNSVLAFNFPYLERGDESSSGPELKEELETLKEMLTMIEKGTSYSKIRLIGKSLGGIIASYWIKSLTKEDQKRYEVIILGYVTGDVQLKQFEGKITIIQGEKDKYGNIEVTKKDLSDAISEDIQYFEVKNADHSYRNPNTKEPIYEDDVIKILNSL